MDENKPQVGPGGAYDGLVLGIAWIVTITATIAGYAPLLVTFFLISFVIAGVITNFLRATDPTRQTIWQTFLEPLNRPLSSAVLAFCAYIALSSLWSADMMTAINKALLIAIIVFACTTARDLAMTTSALQQHRINRGIVIGLLIALAFPIIELATNLSILNTVASTFPGIIQTTGEAQPVPNYYLNKSVSALGLFFWPAYLVISVWQGQRWGRFLKPVLIVAIASATFLSQSETAKVALMFGTLGFLIARPLPRTVHLVAQTMSIIAFLGTVPLVMVLHWSGVQNSPWLAYSASDRIHIWNYTAKQIPEHPILGIGVRTSRSYKQSPKPVTPTSNPGQLRDRQGWHSHNIFLQTWYELGAVGAAFLLAISLFMLQSIKQLDHRRRPFAYAAFASFGATAAFGYGIWQSWLLASFGWTVIFFIFALQYAKIDDQTENPAINPK